MVIGNAAQMNRIGADPKPLDAAADRHRSEGAGVILIAIDGALAGLLAVADPVRASARDAIAALRKEGLRVIMLTGDNRGTADAVARAVGGLDDVRADLRPEDKARIIGELKAGGAKVAMAGDGINDAPALAAADVGLAMGTGNGRSDRKRRHDAHARRSLGDRARPQARPCDDAEYSAEPVSSRFCLTGLASRSRPVCSTLLPASCCRRCWPAAAMALSSFTVVLNALRLNAVKL